MNRKIVLTKEQELEKQKYMKDLEKNIKELEYKINNVDKENLKINTLKRFKIWLKFCQLISPFIAAAGLTFGIFSIFGITPFYINDKKQKLETKKTIDSLGNIRYEEQYYNYENNTDIISYYGKWKKDNNNQYSRAIKVYSLGNLSKKKILELIEGNKIDKLELLLGEPTINRIETINNLEDKDLETEPYLEAIVYDQDKNDFIMVKQTISDDISDIMLWTMLNLVLGLLIACFRETYTKFSYKDSVKEIEEETIPLDVESLKKILILKKDNYERLTRQ